jgi:hypothetical protein
MATQVAQTPRLYWRGLCADTIDGAVHEMLRDRGVLATGPRGMYT